MEQEALHILLNGWPFGQHETNKRFNSALSTSTSAQHDCATPISKWSFVDLLLHASFMLTAT